MIRRVIDRCFGLLAIALARGFHRTVAVEHMEAARAPGPRVLVVNHFNGFMDVVVVVAALGRLPRLVGKATLGNVVVLRPILRLAGVVLVQRRVDGEGTAANVSAFAQCHERLRRGETIVIFPEGTTHDRESLAPIRTGAARIALGAVTAGVQDVTVVPVGLTFGDKNRLRNDVLVAGGDAIRVGSEGEHDAHAVDALTARIGAGLRALVAELDDPIEVWSIERAVTIARRAPGFEPELAQTRGGGRRVAHAPEEARAAVLRAVGDYTLALDLAGVDDAALIRSDPPRVVTVVVLGVLAWFAWPVVAPVVLVNAPAIAVIAAVDWFVTVPVTKGTVRALLAVVLFPATWITTAVLLVDGALLVTVFTVGHAVVFLLTVGLVETAVEEALQWWRHHRARVAVGRIPALTERRRRVVEAVAATEPVGAAQ